MRFPIFTMFFVYTLNVWIFVLGLLISPVLVFLIETHPIIFSFFGLIVGPVLLWAFCSRFFRWFFISFELTLGRLDLQDNMAKELESRYAKGSEQLSDPAESDERCD